MRAPRTGTMKRFERVHATAAAKELDAAIDGYYYEEYPLMQGRERYKRLLKAQTTFNAYALAYFLGVSRTSVAARLKRRAARRKAAAQTSMAAA